MRRLVDLMDGDVDLRSTPGVGTTVTMRLLLPMVDAATPTEAAGPAPPPPGLSVIAADDNEINRTVLAALLDAHGATHRIAEDGAGALALAREEVADLLLLDISMPGMSGIETLEAIRALEHAVGRAPTPAVAVTANAMRHHVESYQAAGFAAHAAKPLTIASLGAAMTAALAAAPALDGAEGGAQEGAVGEAVG